MDTVQTDSTAGRTKAGIIRINRLILKSNTKQRWGSHTVENMMWNKHDENALRKCSGIFLTSVSDKSRSNTGDISVGRIQILRV